ncbi:peptide ligase PGM1-related protein [Streptomonospora sp. S1-112]|uniref:Peptide ligase PGM1-related protein n=1 Tax=Streptomonospora mangrovi TaxID=2883123 RepID=A0A9X3SGI7_9ACTN|nr:peptide ligase PGM1-related protein [Streptomonospora mangrovi]MDA0564194.1 peptide ligase PGM1-related protein [Streptomonospora mangrovi]
MTPQTGQNHQAAFTALQRRLVSPLDGSPRPRTVLVLPSFSLDPAGMAKIPGILHYEERLLAFLHLLRVPDRRIVYATSTPVPPVAVDYALGLVRSLPARHARPRLTLVDCADASPRPLTQKILARPDVVERLRRAVGDPRDACILAFNGSPHERDLALRLGVPLFACRPDLAHLGSKSGAREVFAEAGVPFPAGFGHLRDEDDLVTALAALRARAPAPERAMIKVNDGFGAGGNALFDFRGAPTAGGVEAWVRAALPRRVTFATPPEDWERYSAKFAEMGGVVEEFVEGADSRSPSAQVSVSPTGEARVLSTQDQFFVGAGHQTYAGCTAPAHPDYRRDVHDLALRTGRALAGKGVVGIASVDFVSARADGVPRLLAAEINLRMGGGTAPRMFLEGVADARLDEETGGFRAPDGRPLCYLATDRLESEAYRGLTPEAVLAAARRGGLLYDERAGAGAVFHMLGALPGFGKMGAVVIDRTTSAAHERYQAVVAALDAAAAAAARGPGPAAR